MMKMGKYLSDPPRDKADDTYLNWKDNVENYDGCYYFVAVSKKTKNYIGTCSKWFQVKTKSIGI